MKPDETIFKVKKRYLAIMLLCFLYGGFSILSFLSQAYTFFWLSELPRPGYEDLNRNVLDSNNFIAERPRGVGVAARDPMTLLSSPTTLMQLVGGLIAIFAGIAIWKLVRDKEIKTIKQHASDNLLLPDEKRVVDVLKESNYESTQSRIVKQSGLSKVQVHRAIKRLESKGVLEKHGYGLTNKIILKKEFFE